MKIQVTHCAILVGFALVGGYVIGNLHETHSATMANTPVLQVTEGTLIEEGERSDSKRIIETELETGSTETNAHPTVQHDELVKPPVAAELDNPVTVPSANIEELVADYGSLQTFEQALNFAEEFLVLLRSDPDLLQEVLHNNVLPPEHKNILLSGIFTVADSRTRDEIRDYALALTNSSDEDTAREGLLFLSSVDLTYDTAVRHRLVEIGLGTQSPDDMLQVAASMTVALVPPLERSNIIAMFSEYTQSDIPELRALAVHRLGEWGHSDTFRLAVNEALYDPDPSVRASSVRSIAQQSALLPEYRNHLLTMVDDQHEDSMVRISAAEALSQFNLNEEEYRLVRAALVAENILEIPKE